MASNTIKSGKKEGNILVAPLNWGLGHATRCIPIIIELKKQGFNPIIASDGAALQLLRREFPKLKSIELASYGISYPKKGEYLKLKLIFNLPRVVRTIQAEKKFVSELIRKEQLIGIISDNRLGVRSTLIPSIYITHQINVLSGVLTILTSKIHQYYIQKFDQYWVPDISDENNLSGVLSNYRSNKIRRIGILSRFSDKVSQIKYDLLVLLSGLEPYRTQLEAKLLKELEGYKGSVLFVRGVFKPCSLLKESKNIVYRNFLKSEELETAIAQSKLILTRSGYSTIMDLAKMNKKAFFIPTYGQTEQEYLAEHMDALNIAPYSSEQNFKIEMLKRTENYSGFNIKSNKGLPKDLFHLFHSK